MNVSKLLGDLVPVFKIVDDAVGDADKRNALKAELSMRYIEAAAKWTPIGIVGLLVGVVVALHIAWLAFGADWLGRVAVYRWELIGLEVALLVLCLGGQVDPFRKALEAVGDWLKKRKG